MKLRIKGEDREGFAQAESDDVAQISAALKTMLTTSPGDARYYGVTFDANGHPNMDELRRAATEAAMIRISLGDAQERANHVPAR